jgi:hypothetical protein
MRKTFILTLLLAGCGPAEKAPPLVPDYGPETGDKEDSATRPATTVPIAYGQLMNVVLGNGLNWRAFKFDGLQGQILDLYAQGLDGTDTVLYLYKVSRLTGRPYGKPVGFNDDADHGGWSLQKAAWNEYSSMIPGAVLPEDRPYAVVITTYNQEGGTALIKVQPRGAVFPTTIPAFDGTATGKAIHFAENLGDGNTKDVLDAMQVPASSTLVAAVSGANTGMVPSVSVYRADPDALAAALADPDRKANLAYGLLLGDSNTTSYDATWTPVTRGTAVAELMQAAAPDGDSGMQALVTFVVQSMFHDAAFRASDVSVYRLHWDNSDDTNAEGLAAVKASTGEIRVLSLDNPP